jgi:C4-dicarboxylate-specific signal transduction histidine kinase
VIVAIKFAGYGLRFHPVVLAVAWIGLRFGVRAAWLAWVAAALAILPVSAGYLDEGSQIGALMLVAVAAAIGHLAGTSSDAQKAARAGIERRDRVIFHAERLKTLRAMSVAIIHELSQPLSTLSIEARYLARLAEQNSNDQELKSVAALVARKADNISSLIKRLRSFGARTDDELEVISIDNLLHEVIGVAAPEAKAAGVRLEIRIEQGIAVEGWRVELQQAVLNLLRNAFAASPDSTVELTARRASRGKLALEVVNHRIENAAKSSGMGVGRLVVEAIAEARGGSLTEEVSADGWKAALILPCLAVPEAAGA